MSNGQRRKGPDDERGALQLRDADCGMRDARYLSFAGPMLVGRGTSTCGTDGRIGLYRSLQPQGTASFTGTVRERTRGGRGRRGSTKGQAPASGTAVVVCHLIPGLLISGRCHSGALAGARSCQWWGTVDVITANLTEIVDVSNDYLMIIMDFIKSLSFSIAPLPQWHGQWAVDLFDQAYLVRQIPHAPSPPPGPDLQHGKPRYAIYLLFYVSSVLVCIICSGNFKLSWYIIIINIVTSKAKAESTTLFLLADNSLIPFPLLSFLLFQQLECLVQHLWLLLPQALRE